MQVLQMFRSMERSFPLSKESLLIIMCSVVFLLGNQTELQGIDVEVHILRSEMNNCVCQVDKLRKEFVELKEEIEASRYLMDSVRELVVKLLTKE